MCRPQGQGPGSEKGGEGERERWAKTGGREGKGRRKGVRGIEREMEEERERVRGGKEGGRVVVGRGSFYLWFRIKRILSPVGTEVPNFTDFER